MRKTGKKASASRTKKAAVKDLPAKDGKIVRAGTGSIKVVTNDLGPDNIQKKH